MHAERRANGVNLLPPTRTTRMNGGPRPATERPLPPFRPIDADDRSHGWRSRTTSAATAPVRGFPPDASSSLADAPSSLEPAHPFEPAERIVAPYTFEPSDTTPSDADDTGTEVDDFPLDAFIIPEGAERLPTGLVEADRRQRQRASELADRLEALAWRLRREGYSALARQTAHGDPVDALIAGILAGYLAAGNE